MTEERLDELINLYLDNEIGRSDLGELKHAIKDNLVRRRKFERACQLHQAARKALTTPASGESTQGRSVGAGSARTGSRFSAGRKPNPSALQNHLKSKQGLAHRNASVDTLAERQEKEGAASTVELDKIEDEPRSGSRSYGGSGAARTFTFFDSPLGMLVAFLLIMVGCLGFYFILRSASPVESVEPDKSSETAALSPLNGSYDPKAAEELAAEVKKQNAVTVAADAMRARLYQSALTGQSANTPATVDYFSSHLDPVTTSSTAETAGPIMSSSVELNAPLDKTNPPETNAVPAAQP